MISAQMIVSNGITGESDLKTATELNNCIGSTHAPPILCPSPSYNHMKCARSGVFHGRVRPSSLVVSNAEALSTIFSDSRVGAHCNCKLGLL